MKKVSILTVVLIVFALLAYPKVKPLFSSSPDSSRTESGQAANDRLNVEAVQLEYETIDDQIFTSGSILADEEVELSAEASGIVTGIFIDEGSYVDEGELLLKINDSELQAEKQRAAFRLALAEQREERQRRLLERGGISQDDYDATLNEVNVIRSELDLINARINQTEIRAPFSGRIGLKYVSEGSYISPNSRIATLQALDRVKIDFSVPERYMARVSEGDKITFTVQGIDSTFTGEVYAIEPRINRETRTIQLRARSENEGHMLFPGAFTNITLILDSIEDALMVPTISLIPELNSQKLYVVRNDEVSEVRVQTGIRTSEKVQITEGVAVGDTVLTTGLLQVNPGMKVNITNMGSVSDYE
ncbi:MAG: efflux RND transporter periplasmic adaptor subunit [Bacteroidetes bacterium]|nr:efflux RND transporter periplasmic adaptor subunit [Bacteroidota bacterium]